jgi:hypothetical protein
VQLLDTVEYFVLVHKLQDIRGDAATGTLQRSFVTFYLSFMMFKIYDLVSGWVSLGRYATRHPTYTITSAGCSLTIPTSYIGSSYACTLIRQYYQVLFNLNTLRARRSDARRS